MNRDRSFLLAWLLTGCIAMAACSSGDTPPATTTASTSTPAIVANAGPDQSVFVGTFVTLNGSKSTNANGTGLTYSWTLNTPAGSAATLSNPAAVNPTFTADVGGIYEATLVVTGDLRSSVPDTVIITASGTNPPPVANAGSDQGAFVNTPVVLNGTLSQDINGDALTFAWRLIGAPSGSNPILFDRNTVAPSFTPDTAGIYIVELVVNDGASTSTPATVTVKASNKPSPTAVAGPSATLYFPLNTSPITLDGSSSHTNPPGGELEYAWTFNSPNPAPALIDADKSIARFSPPANVAATYVAQLKVTEKNFPGPEPDFNLDTVSIILGPLASVQAFLLAKLTTPVLTCTIITCGTATVPVGTAIRLDGSDSQVQPLTYLWSITNPLTGATLANPTSATAIFTPNTAASGGTTYSLQLKVTDLGGNTNIRPFNITAKNGPVVSIVSSPLNPGVPSTITMSLSPASTDPSLQYKWEFTSRPSGSLATFANAALQSTTFTADKSGDYGVKLTITDTSTIPNAISSATGTIRANNPPTAVITAPLTVDVCSTVDLSGSSSSDLPDGTISLYTWSLPSRPTGSTAALSVVTSTTPATSFKADKAGGYTVNLRVTDNLGLVSALTTKGVTAQPNATGKAIYDVTGFGTPPVSGLGPKCTDCHAAGNHDTSTNSSGVDLSNPIYTVTEIKTKLTSGTHTGGTPTILEPAFSLQILALRKFLDSTLPTCP